MVSVVDICNQALSYLADSNQSITSIDSEDATAKACKLFLETSRQEIATAIDWFFLRKVGSFNMIGSASGTDTNPLGENPLSEEGWNYTYKIPKDCLKVIAILPEDTLIPTGGLNTDYFRPVQDYVVHFIEGFTDFNGSYIRSLSTNKKDAKIKYQVDIKDLNLYPIEFISILIPLLASKLAMSIKGDKQLAALNLQKYQELLTNAKMDMRNVDNSYTRSFINSKTLNQGNFYG